MLSQYLLQLGLSEKEILVYLCILENGKISATDISKLTKINRTTVYSVSKELLEKFLISEDIGSEIRYFSANSSDSLQHLFAQEEQDLISKKEIASLAIKELESIPKAKLYSVPKIRFIEEAKMNDFLYKQLPIWIESAKQVGDKCWWGYQDASFIEAYPDWFKYHWDVYPEDYSTRLITNKKSAEKEFAKKIKNERRQVKYWDKTVEFSATHAVLGNYVMFVVTNQHPHYLVETHDSVMAHNFREMFKGFWENFDYSRL